MKLKASLAALLTLIFVAALALPALAAAPIRYEGVITGLPAGTGVAPVVTLQVVKKKGKIVEIQGGGFAGPQITCPGEAPSAPLSLLLTEAIKVKEGRFKSTQKVSTETVTVSGRFNSTGTKATGTFAATAIGISISPTGVPSEVTCTSGTHPWHVAAP
jgi:hypothetical protein